MSCLWLLVLLACCGGNDNGCGGYNNDFQRGGRGRNNDCGCGGQGRGRNNGGRGRDNDCGCDRQSRDNDWGCNDNPSRPVFGRSRNNDTCGCEISEEVQESQEYEEYQGSEE